MRPLLRYYAIGTVVLCGCVPREPETPVAMHAPVPNDPVPPPPPLAFTKKADAPPDKIYQKGYASWYGLAFAGNRTASGERFDPRAMTAAHRTLPMGTWIEVRRPDIGRSVRVRVNDRGPFAGGKDRIVDVSQRAAEQLEMIPLGVVKVELRIVQGPE